MAETDDSTDDLVKLNECFRFMGSIPAFEWVRVFTKWQPAGGRPADPPAEWLAVGPRLEEHEPRAIRDLPTADDDLARGIFRWLVGTLWCHAHARATAGTRADARRDLDELAESLHSTITVLRRLSGAARAALNARGASLGVECLDEAERLAPLVELHHAVGDELNTLGPPSRSDGLPYVAGVSGAAAVEATNRSCAVGGAYLAWKRWAVSPPTASAIARLAAATLRVALDTTVDLDSLRREVRQYLQQRGVGHRS